MESENNKEDKSTQTMPIPPVITEGSEDSFSNDPYSFPIPEDPHWNEDCLTRFMRHIFRGNDY